VYGARGRRALYLHQREFRPEVAPSSGHSAASSLVRLAGCVMPKIHNEALGAAISTPDFLLPSRR
jgi:hypothetical protein